MSTPEDQLSGESTTPVHTVPKWPFVLGDVILVTSALAVWGTQFLLSDTQLIFCLGAVAAGAFLFTVPYMLEHFVRAQEYPEPPTNSAAAEYQRLSALEGDLRRQVRAATEALEQAARANAAFEGSARRFETRLAPLSEIQKKLEAAVAEMREAGTRPSSKEPHPLERDLARLREEHAEKFKAAESKLAKLTEAVSGIADQLTSLAALPVTSTPRAVEPNPAPEKKPEAAGSMLAKALAMAQPAEESPAVAGIIQSRPRRPRKPKPPEGTEAPASPDSPVQPAEPAEPADPASPVDAVPAPATAETPRESWNALAEGKFDQVTASVEIAAEPEGAAVAVAEPPVETAPAPAENFVTEAKTARAKAAALRDDDDDESSATPAESKADEPASAPAQGELLAGAAETARKRRSHKSPADATALVARVLIGIGNKPYVRGEGPGLSPSKGVPMEFVEIGKWQWLAPASAKAPIKLQILKNDEVPAAGEPIVLQPGQNLEVSPVFPA